MYAQHKPSSRPCLVLSDESGNGEKKSSSDVKEQKGGMLRLEHGSNVLLYAVGAAVIGGTSLFGGKGRVLDAVLGGAVVAVIDNGMGLMGYSSGVKYVVTGVVLLLAASVDAFSRRRSTSTGNR